MFTSTRGGRTSKSRSMIVPLSGYFDDGQWMCNCKPRKPAARFQVKKAGPNTGKWFYTCQEPKDQGCNFFLWEDKAIEREKKAVLGNSRTEVTPRSPTIEKNPPSAGKTFEEHMQRSSNRQRLGKSKDEDEEFDWPLSPGEEIKVEDAVARASVEVYTPQSSFSETPRKSLRHESFDTPGSKRKRGNEAYPTPSTRFSSPGDDPFTSTTTSRGSLFYDSKRMEPLSPLATPTPNRFRDATALNNIHDSPGSNTTHDNQLTDEVMDLLKGQHVDEETASKLRTLLNRYVLKSKGIIKGREITREALRAKDVKILDLQERLLGLEREREMDRLVIKKLKDKSARGGNG